MMRIPEELVEEEKVMQSLEKGIYIEEINGEEVKNEEIIVSSQEVIMKS